MFVSRWHRVVGCALLCAGLFASPAVAQQLKVVVLAPTGTERDGLQVLTLHPSPQATLDVLTRGFSGRLLRLYSLEQILVQRTTGVEPQPAYLLLSDRDGGFPQTGFYLGDVKKPDVGWVDLHKNSRLSGHFGALDQIFPHELMHVIVRQLAGELHRSGSNQIHAIGVRTDPVNAFTEGLAEAMQILAVDDADAMAATKALPMDARLLARAEHDYAQYARDLSRWWSPVQPSRLRYMLWANSAEQVMRYHGVRANQFARATDVPDLLLSATDLFPAYLIANVVPANVTAPPKSASAMLSSEGVVAHIAWRLLTDDAVRQRRARGDVYQMFGTTAAVGTPLDNVFLKLFTVLHEARPATMAELLRGWSHTFPEDAADVERITRESLLGQALPSQPELWLLNASLLTGTSLFDQYRAFPRPHTFDANAATRLDWMSIGGITRAEADALVAGAPYTSLDALKARAPANVSTRIDAMAQGMAALISRGADAEETLSLSKILWSYAARLGAIIALATVFGAWLAGRAGARRWWTACLVALVATVIVIGFVWIITSPWWYPMAAPLVLGALPWTLWRLARRRDAPAIAQPALIWIAASLPAYALVWL